MKKTSYFVSLALAAIAAMPVIANAQTMMDVEGAAGINATVDGGPEDVPANLPASIRAQLRADVENNMQNVRNNEDFRNTVMQHLASTTGREFGSTTLPHGFPPPGRGNGEDGTGIGHDMGMDGGRFGTTTGTSTFPGMPGKRGGEDNGYVNMGRGMQRDIFNARKRMIVNQLETALDNLKQVRTRISARIQTAETSGHDETAALSLLSTADVKIQDAQDAVDALSSLSISASSTVAITASSTVDLAKPRQVAEAAILALKNARRALNDVVVAIAKSMGFEVGDDGRILAPSPSPSINPSASAAPTPTGTPTPSATDSPSTSPTPSPTA
ncbi:MAG: hypothetical protein KGI59_02310 [Patescibacteria group bacterium]|nr:hypothetical protein [Patescibacteria group bacterium]MDE2172841.1 hypothetical protein [Patescibacteria group bacterium]